MKHFKVEVPKGYEIDKGKSTFENIVFKEINKLPSSWEDLKRIEGYYIDEFSNIDSYLGMNHNAAKYVFKTEEQAEASMALAQLSQLRDVYREGWLPNWTYYDERKYCIEPFDEEFNILNYGSTMHFLSFQDKKTAELFLENFRPLIEKAKPLMS